jgi:hypothetical protein
MRIGWLATGLVVLVASASLRAQVFYATGGGGQIIGGTGTGHTDTLYIDPSGAQGQFPMPWIYLHYTGTQTCPAPQVRIAITYTDPATGLVYTKDSVAQDVGGGVVASYSSTGWFGGSETESFGGSDAQAQYSMNDGQGWTTFVTFTILGVNLTCPQLLVQGCV